MVETRSFFGGKARLFSAPAHGGAEGKLVAFDFARLPLVVQRAFLIEEVPAGRTRGGHAHATESQLLIALSGEVVVELQHGGEEMRVELSSSTEALLVEPGVWFQQTYRSPEAKLLVFANALYDPAGYIRERIEWRK